VGRHFRPGLLDRDYDVTVVDDLSTGMVPESWPKSVCVREKRAEAAYGSCGAIFASTFREAPLNFALIVSSRGRCRRAPL